MTNQAQEAERIVLLEPVQRISYAEKLIHDGARDLHQGVVEKIKEKYANAPWANAYWQYNKETGEINGSNFQLMVVANEVLAPSKKRTLTFDEAMQLDKQGKLTNGVYRDLGLAIYSDGSPNKELATPLIIEAQKRNWQLPILAHPSSFVLKNKGLEFAFSEDDSLIIHGEQAKEALRRFSPVGYSGLRRLDRYRGGHWNADWGVAGSSASGRVDFVRAEGTRADFEARALE
ncbi:MAG: hypothetical protein AABW79_04510 [Nanoarchaeota archaeon]